MVLYCFSEIQGVNRFDPKLSVTDSGNLRAAFLGKGLTLPCPVRSDRAELRLTRWQWYLRSQILFVENV